MYSFTRFCQHTHLFHQQAKPKKKYARYICAKCPGIYVYVFVYEYVCELNTYPERVFFSAGICSDDLCHEHLCINDLFDYYRRNRCMHLLVCLCVFMWNQEWEGGRKGGREKESVKGEKRNTHVFREEMYAVSEQRLKINECMYIYVCLCMYMYIYIYIYI